MSRCTPASHTALKRIQHLRKCTYISTPVPRVLDVYPRPTCTRCTSVLVPRFVYIHTSPTCIRCLSIQVPRVLRAHPNQSDVYSMHIHTSPTCTQAYPYQTHVHSCISIPVPRVLGAHPHQSHVYSVHIHTSPTCTWCNLHGYYYQRIFFLITFDVQNDVTTDINIYLRKTLTFNRSNVQYKFKRKRETDFKNGTVSY